MRSEHNFGKGGRECESRGSMGISPPTVHKYLTQCHKVRRRNTYIHDIKKFGNIIVRATIIF